MATAKHTVLFATWNSICFFVSLAVLGYNVYILVDSTNYQAIVGLTIYHSLIGLAVIFGVTSCIYLYGILLSFSERAVASLVYCILMAGGLVCEVAIGIFMELKKNEEVGLLGIPGMLSGSEVTVISAIEEKFTCVDNGTRTVTSRYGCMGNEENFSITTCSFKISDFYCLLLLVLEVATLFLVIIQVLSIIIAIWHTRVVWGASKNQVHPMPRLHK